MAEQTQPAPAATGRNALVVIAVVVIAFAAYERFRDALTHFDAAFNRFLVQL